MKSIKEIKREIKSLGKDESEQKAKLYEKLGDRFRDQARAVLPNLFASQRRKASESDDSYRSQENKRGVMREAVFYKKAAEAYENASNLSHDDSLLHYSLQMYESAIGYDAGDLQRRHSRGQKIKNLIQNKIIELSRKLNEREKREKEAGLVKKIFSVTSIIGILGMGAGAFFLSSNITGNAIGNMTNSTSNIIGAVLLVIGLIGGFFWVKNKRNK